MSILDSITTLESTLENLNSELVRHSIMKLSIQDDNKRAVEHTKLLLFENHIDSLQETIIFLKSLD